jgi:putative DNA methylase
MTNAVKVPKKLIEVALPLDSINAAAIKEKGNPFLKGHPRNFHQWWARRPQAIARAVIFGQMVNDPSWKWEMEHPGEIPPSNLKASWAASRKRLFAILEELVKWENTTNEEVLEKARAEIRKSWRETCELNKDHPQATELFHPDKVPPVHDPFAGGGAIPLEAQRLGLEAYASDLNPVAVLINKALIEIPPKFTARPPVNPDWLAGSQAEKVLRQWHGAQGLAEDVRYYARWMRDKARKRIGGLYPPVEITAEMAKGRADLKPLVGNKLTPIAWLWARTVKSPNPAFRHANVPLVSTFILCGKEGKEAYLHPMVDGDRYRFTVRVGNASEEAKNGTRLGSGASFRCLLSGAPIAGDYIKAEGRSGRIGVRLIAIVAEGERGRVYLPPTPEQESAAAKANPEWRPDIAFFQQALGFRVGNYGMTKWSDLFTLRQLAALSTYSDLVSEVRNKVYDDARAAGMINDDKGLNTDGTGARAYADALALIQALAIDKLADYNNTICAWNPTNQNIGHLFTKQTIQMSWDFSEASPIEGGLSVEELSGGIARSIELLPASVSARAFMHDCGQEVPIDRSTIICTDPPYYDNIGYADLSDFFYVWLRRSLKPIFPELFATLTTPKDGELVATPSRHGSKEGAEAFFVEGMTQAMHRLVKEAHPAFPVTIYYAFKQSENEVGASSSRGWETFLEAVKQAGFAITGTWPMRTEREARSRGLDSNALASSISLVCRPLAGDAPTISRRVFLRELNRVLPEALDEITRGTGDDRSPVAPVDLSQAIIGPGMAVFSKYAAVLEADGTPMSVKTALQLINRFFAEDDFDHDTQFCLHWFEQNSWKDGKFGDADTLARAKGTSVDGVKHAGVLYAAGGVVRLRKWAEYPSNWEPARDSRLPVWEVLHHLIRVFRSEGENGAGAVLAAVQAKAEATRQLAYRLYTLCERSGWAEDARAYNEIITSWSAIESAAVRAPEAKQAALFDA